MATFKRKLKVNKTDAYVLDVSAWLSTDAITSLNVFEDGTAFTSVGSTSWVGGKLMFLVTGVAVGVASIHFEYSTSTRNDCYVANLNVIEDC